MPRFLAIASIHRTSLARYRAARSELDRRLASIDAVTANTLRRNIDTAAIALCAHIWNHRANLAPLPRRIDTLFADSTRAPTNATVCGVVVQEFLSMLLLLENEKGAITP